MDVKRLIMVILFSWPGDCRPSVNIFMATYNGTKRVNGLPWQAPFADLGFEYLKETYGEVFDFSLDYVTLDETRIALTDGMLDYDIENMISKHYYAHIGPADAMAHIYCGAVNFSTLYVFRSRISLI